MARMFETLKSSRFFTVFIPVLCIIAVIQIYYTIGYSNDSANQNFERTTEMENGKNMLQLQIDKRTMSVRNFSDPWFCQLDHCHVGEPCEYKDEVDFRIIVQTFDRPHSVANCLLAISKVDTIGKHVSVEIWIDRSNSGHWDEKTIQVANNFSKTWKNGRTCIHLRERNAFIDGQWIDTWKPKENTKEIALILEDDVDIAPKSLKWLEHVHREFWHRDDIGGYALQMQNNKFAKTRKPLKGPVNDTIFLYRMFATWGFAPHHKTWRSFQKWFHINNGTIKPYVEGLLTTEWYKMFEKRGEQRGKWDSWFTYYLYINNIYSVFCNLITKLNRQDVHLCYNREEKGLHYSKRLSSGKVHWHKLMHDWSDDFVQFPQKVERLSYDGKHMEPLMLKEN